MLPSKRRLHRIQEGGDRAVIPSRFEQQVRKYPDRIAVKTRRGTLTYDALDKAANRVAHAILTARGEGKEPIAFLLEHEATMMIAVLGVLKAGKIFVVLEPSLPRARKALPAPDQSRPEQENPFVPPSTVAEKTIAEIWTQVLKVDRVGIHDNFFESGGHSLLATQVLSGLCRLSTGITPAQPF